MRTRALSLVLLLCTFWFADASAQTMPLVYDVESTGADCPIPYMPTLDQLSVIQSLPDPFEWADGRGRMKNYSDWRLRRAEISAQIQNYEIGEKPSRPDSITASYSAGVLTVKVTVNDQTLTLTSQVVLPSGTGPFPAVIGVMSPTGSIPDSIFSDRNIAEIAYNINQVTTYGSPSTSDPYYRLYPDLNPTNTGQYSAWAWGVSRIIDGLELVQNVLPIDLKHIAVTGCSYAGKLALFAGAFDERIALTIAQESGGGGATSWRYSHSLPAGTVEDIDNTDYNWFENSMIQFSSDNVSKLPEDHHELMAMVAPRALYVTGNPDYTWLSNPSCYVASEACKQVYDALGISDRFGYSIVGGHAHCQVPSSQIPEIIAFVDKFLLGQDTVNTSNIADNPYSIDLSPWITWTKPTLSNDTTYFSIPAYPTAGQTGLDTTVTLKWSKIEKAQEYYIQLSTDPSFQTVDQSDSTAADTSITFSGLSKTEKYYWRVQVRTATDLGPWSNVYSFVTTLTPPSTPEIVSAAPSQNGYYTFTWNKEPDAAQYSLQVSTTGAFASIFKSTSTTDTSKTLTWFSENQNYYWRVQASNIAGSGPWSSVSHFAVIYAPTNLVLQRSGSSEITLTWNNNSAKEDGTVIERAQSPDTSFAVIDTVKGSGTDYVDNTVEQGQAYSYRVKAYNDSLESAYSNEASSLTGVREEGGIPTKYSLSQNYPNPFNPTTQIKFALPKSALTRLTVYDVLGRAVQTLIDGKLEAGYYEVNFDASKFPSGVYFYRIEAVQAAPLGRNFTETQKLLLLK